MSGFLDPVFKKYPKEASRIRELILRDPLFRSACHDYCDTYIAIRNWQSSSSPNSQARIAEFNQILKEIEVEITEALANEIH